jgi:hypothetical protein
MFGCDARPGNPPDRTVRGDRRPRDPFRAAPRRPAEAAAGRGAGLPGRGAGPAGRPVRAALDADVPDPPGPPVPVPAGPVRVPQAGRGGGAAAGRGPGSPGPPAPVLARPREADRRHPRAVRHVAGDRAPLGPGRPGRVRVLPVALPVVLGAEALPGHHPGRDARGVVPGSSPSTTPSRASSTWNDTAAAPPPACTPASPSASWPWPSPSGTTGPPASPTSAPSSPTTTDIRTQSSSGHLPCMGRSGSCSSAPAHTTDKPGRAPSVTGSPPLGDQARVQALPAQDRALITRRRRGAAAAIQLC